MNLENGLSVVIPFFNEEKYISECVTHAIAALSKSGIPYQIVLVDDGSTDSGIQSLKNLSELEFVEFVIKPHSGRIETRLEGVKKSAFESVLMLDARVQLEINSITNLARLCEGNPSSQFWNGHVEMANLNLPHVSVWQTLVGIGWGEYLKNPRLCHFGLADFDAFPKGTGIFMASRCDWNLELEKLAGLQEISATALSDDTRLLREFAAKSDIWISPEFKATYFPRTSFGAFTKNLVYRGTTFVDSYWGSRTLIGFIVRTIVPLTLILTFLVALILPLKVWLFGVFGVLSLLSLFLGSTSYRFWGSVSRATKELLIGFVFWPLFGIGLIRGYAGHIKNGFQIGK